MRRHSIRPQALGLLRTNTSTIHLCAQFILRFRSIDPLRDVYALVQRLEYVYAFDPVMRIKQRHQVTNH